jgi:four helix bundle protein
MQDFKQLLVWQKAHALTLDVYKVSSGFPKEELYSLTSQIRRSAASIPTNIAEGCGRTSKLELIHFLQVAIGSASELEYQLLLSKDLQLMSLTEYEGLCANTVEIKRMLTGLIKRAKTTSSP